jgi:preprotein translocase subunit SecG
MLQTLLTIIYAFLTFFAVIIVLIQRGKSSSGMGRMGGGSQMLFGASGGQDVLQKTTWVVAALIMGGCLMLGVMKSRQYAQGGRIENVAIPFNQTAE